MAKIMKTTNRVIQHLLLVEIKGSILSGLPPFAKLTTLAISLAESKTYEPKQKY